MAKVLEIGAGKVPVNTDWDIMDIVPYSYVNYVHDICQLPLPLKSSTYDLIYMSHILEVVPWEQTIDFLKEVRRALKNGGVVEIWVTDFERLVSCYIKHQAGDQWWRHNPNHEVMVWLNGRIFSYEPHWQRTIFNRSYLKQCLRQAGFRHTDPLDKPRGYDHGFINLGLAAVTQ